MGWGLSVGEMVDAARPRLPEAEPDYERCSSTAAWAARLREAADAPPRWHRIRRAIYTDQAWHRYLLARCCGQGA
jgi:hypothetical protein